MKMASKTRPAETTKDLNSITINKKIAELKKKILLAGELSYL